MMKVIEKRLLKNEVRGQLVFDSVRVFNLIFGHQIEGKGQRGDWTQTLLDFRLYALRQTSSGPGSAGGFFICVLQAHRPPPPLALQDGFSTSSHPLLPLLNTLNTHRNSSDSTTM